MGFSNTAHFYFGGFMTIPASDRQSQLYVGNGVNTRFDFNFRVFDQEDESGILVRARNGTDWVNVDKSKYILTLNSDNQGGFIDFLTPPETSTYFYILGNTPKDQNLDITNYDNFYPEALEKALDKITAILIEWKQLLDSETLSRILADISYDELAQQREADLKAYIDGIASAVIGHPVLGLPAEFVIDGLENQKQINKKTIKYVGTIQDLIDIQNPYDGQIVSVTSYYSGWAGLTEGPSGGGGFVYDSSRAVENDMGSVIKGWVRQEYGDIRDFGARSGYDSTQAIKANLRYLKKIGGGELAIPKGGFIVSEPIDMGEYCVTNLNTQGPYPFIKVNIDIKGVDFSSSKLIWKGGDGQGGYGTCLLLRSRAESGQEIYYYGSVSDVGMDVFDLDAKKGHIGGWPVTNRFTTNSSLIASCNPVAGSLVTYPILIDKTNPQQGASCGIYLRGISSASLKRVQVRGFAFGYWGGVGYGTAVDSVTARWCMVGWAFRDAITTTTLINSIFEKCAVGVMFQTSSHVGLGTGCVVQGNYAGCDVLFHTWNRRIRLDNVYFEASLKGIVIRTDSSGQYRNSEVTIKDCTGVQLDIDVAAISEISIENNHIQSTQFNATGTGLPDAAQHYAVRVKNNYTYDNSTGERRKMLWNGWNIPDRFLYCEDTMQITGFDIQRVDAISAGAKTNATKIQIGNDTNDFSIKIPNSKAACALKIEGVATRYGDDLKDLLYFTAIVAVTRKPGTISIAEVSIIDSKLLAAQATGISILTPAVVTATVTGSATDINTVSIKASKSASGANTAIQVLDAKLLTALGTVQMNKV